MTAATIGDYRIGEVVGAGRIGVVHRAVDLRSGRPVALKLLREGSAADPGLCSRFRREAALLRMLQHPHVIEIYEAGEADGRLFLTMPLLSGTTAKDLVSDGALEPARALAILDAVASALDATHAAGIVHRDVKPRNVLLDGDAIYLSDFGLASGPDDIALTSPGDIVGTLDYMAPEHLDGWRPEAPADVYALACMAIELLTGEVPFPRETDAAVMHAHVAIAPPRVSERRGQLPAALDDVLLAGMAKDPCARPASAGALAAQLRVALGAAPQSAIASS